MSSTGATDYRDGGAYYTPYVLRCEGPGDVDASRGPARNHKEVAMPEQLSMFEQWRPVAGWEGVYDVSSHGRIRSHYGDPFHILRPSLDKDGYQKVILCAAPRKVYQRVAALVTVAFHGPRPQGHVVCHNDGDHTNDRADNLRWDTQAANIADKHTHGTMARGERVGNAVLRDVQAAEILRRYRAGECRADLASAYGVARGVVYQLCAGKTYRHVDV